MRHLSSLGCECGNVMMPALRHSHSCRCVRETVNKEWRRSEFKKNKPAPAPRFQHSAVYSRARDRMFVFGGQGDKNAVMADLWSFDFSCVSRSLSRSHPHPPTHTFTCSFLWASCASHLLLVCGADCLAQSEKCKWEQLGCTPQATGDAAKQKESSNKQLPAP